MADRLEVRAELLGCHLVQRGVAARESAGVLGARRHDVVVHEGSCHRSNAWGPTPTPDAVAPWRSGVSRTGRWRSGLRILRIVKYALSHGCPHVAELRPSVAMRSAVPAWISSS